MDAPAQSSGNVVGSSIINDRIAGRLARFRWRFRSVVKVSPSSAYSGRSAGRRAPPDLAGRYTGRKYCGFVGGYTGCQRESIIDMGG